MPYSHLLHTLTHAYLHDLNVCKARPRNRHLTLHLARDTSSHLEGCRFAAGEKQLLQFECCHLSMHARDYHSVPAGPGLEMKGT